MLLGLGRDGVSDCGMENNHEARIANHDLGLSDVTKSRDQAGPAEIIVKWKWHIQDKALIGLRATNKMQEQVAQIPMSPLSWLWMD